MPAATAACTVATHSSQVVAPQSMPRPPPPRVNLDTGARVPKSCCCICLPQISVLDRTPTSRGLQEPSAKDGGNVAAIDGCDVGGGLQRQRMMQEGLCDVLGHNLATQQVADHVCPLIDAAGMGALSDELRRQEAASYAIGVDRIGTNPVASIVDRILAN